MALLWETLATREVRLLALSMRETLQDRRLLRLGQLRALARRHRLDVRRRHDAARLGIDGNRPPALPQRLLHGALRRQLRTRPALSGEPAHGRCAHLGHAAPRWPGWNRPCWRATTWRLSIWPSRRILLLYSVVASIGGIPLIYLGDEVGTLNDYSYRDDPAKAGDSRWVHRPATDWARMDKEKQGRIYKGITHLLDARRATPAFADGGMEVVDTGNPHVFSFVRHHEAGRVLVLANFSEREQIIAANEVQLYGLGYSFHEIVTGENLRLEENIRLEPYRFMWLAPEK